MAGPASNLAKERGGHLREGQREKGRRFHLKALSDLTFPASAFSPRIN
jgi:hypothetical protein